MPDTDWIKDLIPEIDINKVTSDLIKAGENIKGKANEIDLGKYLQCENSLNRYIILTFVSISTRSSFEKSSRFSKMV